MARAGSSSFYRFFRGEGRVFHGSFANGWGWRPRRVSTRHARGVRHATEHLHCSRQAVTVSRAVFRRAKERVQRTRADRVADRGSAPLILILQALPLQHYLYWEVYCKNTLVQNSSYSE